MPSIIPSYIYTLFASIIVGALLIYASSVSTIGIKNQAEQQQLKNLTVYVAAEACELLSAATANNVATKSTLNIPSMIGNKEYWIQLRNDSSQTWVEAGYGTRPYPTEERTPIPMKASASGSYTSGSGEVVLECHTNSTGTYLELSGGY